MSTEPRYLIRCTRHYYAGNIRAKGPQYLGTMSLEHGHDSTAPLLPFVDRKSAAAAIKSLEGAGYFLESSECSHPTYTPVPESAWSRSVRDQVEYSEWVRSAQRPREALLDSAT